MALAYRVGEVAEQFGVSSGTIRNWIEKGYIQAACLPSGHRRIPLAEVERLYGQIFEFGAPVAEEGGEVVHVSTVPSDEEWGP